MTKLVGAAEELHRIIKVIGRNRKFHGPVVLIAQGEDVRPHEASLASRVKVRRPNGQHESLAFASLIVTICNRGCYNRSLFFLPQSHQGA